MKDKLSKPTIFLLPALVAAMALMFYVGVIQGGDLEPPNGPTMGTTQIPPTWHQILPANDGVDGCSSSRFRCVLPTGAMPDGAAVLNNGTGRVWERRPNVGLLRLWNLIDLDCLKSQSGGVMGWRPPKYEELQSLVDLAAPADPMLPVGHPFIGITSDTVFWSMTALDTSPGNIAPNLAYVETFNGITIVRTKGDFLASIWCA